MTRRLLRWLSRRSTVWLAVVLGVIVSVPALATGWFNDDFVMRLVLEGQTDDIYPLEPWQLYEFTPPELPTPALSETGIMPWFATPELSIRFFRPLSSLLIAADDALFGRSALAGHLSHLVWYLALLVVVARVHRRVLRRAEATLATILYAIAPLHAMALSWVSARHVLVGGTLAALGLLLHLGYRQTGERWRAIGAFVVLSVGLAASELVLCGVVFVSLYELLARDAPWAERIRGAAPSVFVGVVFLGFYVAGGWGAHHSAAYLTPFSNPGAFAAAAVTRIPILLGEAFGGVPSELWGAAPSARPVLAGWGALCAVAVLALIRWRRPRGVRLRRERWLMVATIVAVAPGIGGFIGGRLLAVASIGASALVAVAMVRTLGMTGASGAARWGARAALVALVVLHLGLAPLARLGLGEGMRQISLAEERHARALALDDCPDTDLIYVLTGADGANSMYLASSVWFYEPARLEGYETVRTQSMVASDQRFTRTGERSFVLEVVGDRVSGPIERVFTGAPVEEGVERELREMTVRVTEASEEGWRRARFEIDRPLERACFASWDGEALRLWRPPPVGESVELPYYPGLMGM